MTITINHHHYFHSDDEGQILKQLSIITLKLNNMADELATLNQLVTDLQTSVDTKQAAIASAIAAFEQTIADLTAQLAGGATPAQLQTIIDNVTAAKTDLESTPTA